MARRGSFLTALQENVTVTGNRGNVDYEFENQPAIILEDNAPRFENEQFTIQKGRYIVNIYPPNYDICVNDSITRQPRDANDRVGSSSGQLQVLIVQDIRIIYGKQQLQCRDVATVT